MPNTTLKVLKIFGVKESDIDFNSITNNEYLLVDKKINKLEILFKKIDINND